MKRKTTRQDDEQDLEMLILHREGRTAAQIAALFGATRQSIARRISEIIKHDTQHDPEATRYWRTT